MPLLFRTLTGIALVNGWISQQGVAFWTCSTPYLQKPLRVTTRSLLGMRITNKYHTTLRLKNMVRTRNQLVSTIIYIYLYIYIGNYKYFFPHVSFSSAKIWSEHRFSNCYNRPGQNGHSESLCKVRICSNNVQFFTEKLGTCLYFNDMFSLIKNKCFFPPLSVDTLMGSLCWVLWMLKCVGIAGITITIDLLMKMLTYARHIQWWWVTFCTHKTVTFWVVILKTLY